MADDADASSLYSTRSFTYRSRNAGTTSLQLGDDIDSALGQMNIQSEQDSLLYTESLVSDWEDLEGHTEENMEQGDTDEEDYSSNDEAPAISCNAITIKCACDAELGMVDYLRVLKAKARRFGLRALTRREQEALAQSINSTAAEERHSQKIVELLIKKKTKYVYCQARIRAALMVDQLGWIPERVSEKNFSQIQRPACIIIIRCDFQPRRADILLRCAEVTLEFESDVPSSSTAIGRGSMEPRVLIFSPVSVEDAPTLSMRTTNSGQYFTIGSYFGAGVPNSGVNVRGTAAHQRHEERPISGQRFIHGSERNDPPNSVCWTMGEDGNLRNGVLGSYTLGVVLMCPEHRPVKAGLKIKVRTNYNSHKVYVRAKDIPIHFDFRNTSTGASTLATTPVAISEPIAVAVGSAYNFTTPTYEVHGMSHRANIRNEGALLAVLLAQNQAEAQQKLDEITSGNY